MGRGVLRGCALAAGVAAALGAGAAVVMGQANVITGTTEDDVLRGTPGADRILGLEGRDVIDGGEGNDYIEGGPGRDSLVPGGGSDVIEARDGEPDTVRCVGQVDVVVGADAIDFVRCPGAQVVVGPGELRAVVVKPPRSAAPLHIVYDFAPVAAALHAGAPGLPGLGSVRTAARQYPLGDPFPSDRWLSKVSHTELKGKSAAAMADFLQSRLNRYRFGPALNAELVAIDEVGADFQDDAAGPRLLAAMRILAGRTHAATGEPLSRRVLFYVAPKMVANVGEPNDRELWDSAIAAARLSGGVYLQMYHAASGRVTGPMTQAEWKAYMPRWSSELGSARGRLRVLFSGVGASQDVQWGWARQTPAGRAALRSGAGAYRLGSASEARAWLRNWNRHSR